MRNAECDLKVLPHPPNDLHGGEGLQGCADAGVRSSPTSVSNENYKEKHAQTGHKQSTAAVPYLHGSGMCPPEVVRSSSARSAAIWSEIPPCHWELSAMVGSRGPVYALVVPAEEESYMSDLICHNLCDRRKERERKTYENGGWSCLRCRVADLGRNCGPACACACMNVRTCVRGYVTERESVCVCVREREREREEREGEVG